MSNKNPHQPSLRQSISGCLLLVLFGVFCFGTTLFLHVHEDPTTGKVILHSHPYAAGTSSQPEHQHSKAELQLVQQLSSLIFTAGVLLLVLLAILTFLRFIRNRYITPVYTEHTGKIRQRGPPVFVY